MKVDELIKILSNYPPDCDVLLEDKEGYHEIQYIYGISDYQMIGITLEEESIYVDLPDIGDNPDNF